MTVINTLTCFDGGSRHLFKTGHRWTLTAQLSGKLSSHGRKQSVGLQHRAHPLPAARTEAAGHGVFTGAPAAPRRIRLGLREPRASCAGPGPGRPPAVPEDELWRGVLPVRSRFPSRRLHQRLFKLRSLSALQQPGLCRYSINLDFFFVVVKKK